MFDDLLASNRAFASTFDLHDLPGRAARHLALVTCMVSRIDPLPVLGLRPGDAKVLRNAGGRVTPDVLRSLVLATAFLDVSRIAVMHHTGCALAHGSEEALRNRFTAIQASGTQGWDFLTMPDPDAALAADVDAVRNGPGLPAGLPVEGWRYDVGTGAIHRVIPHDRS